jgi:predicted RNA-binding Zn-ribbon protein involved in translation (DUF1610 family)
MAQPPTDQRSAMLAALQRTKTKLAESRAEAIAAQTPVISAASSMPSTPAARSASTPDFLTFADPLAARQHRDQPQSLQQRSHFIDTWAAKIEAFVYDNTRTTMELPADLTGFDRKTLHQLASQYNLSHHSSAASGGMRRLVLRKDNLFFARNLTKPSDDAFLQLKSNPHGRRDRNTEEEPVSEKEQYADRAAYKAFKKLHKATNQYARAVETGLTAEDAVALDALEGKRQGLPIDDDPAVNRADASSAWEAALQTSANAADTVINAASGAQLYEVCTGCGTRVRLDYDPAKWDCNGACDTCGTQTIWRLETDAASLRNDSGDADNGLSSAHMRGGKRPRDAEDDKAVREDAASHLSVTELVELARMHDLADVDVNWVEAFAASRERQGATTDHVLFCADFADFHKYLPATPAGTVEVFAKITQDDGAPITKKVNTLLKAIETTCAQGEGAAAGTVTRDVYVCFPAFVAAGEMECLLAIVLDASRADETSVKLAAKSIAGAPVICSLRLPEILS